MKNQVLSIEQMQSLQNLGLDTSKASMCWVDFNDQVHEYELMINSPEVSKGAVNYIPCFTLQDIMELLPAYIETANGSRYPLTLQKVDMFWSMGHSTPDDFIIMCPDLHEVAYEMLLWCIENNHIKTSDNETK